MNASFQADELESVPCDYCRAGQPHELFVRPDGMHVVECRTCGLAWLNPRPKLEFVQRFYTKEYFARLDANTSVGYGDYLSDTNRADRIADAEDKLQLLGSMWNPAGTRCLEIGAATGEFCDVLHRAGADVTGYDLSEFAIAEARRRYPHVEFCTGGIESVPSGTRYDAVFAFELIEHVLSPTVFLNAVHTVLKPGGLLIVTTPNLECGRSVGWQRWLGFSMSFEHLYFLSPTSLQTMGETQGFVMERWFTGVSNGIEWGPPPASVPGARAIARKVLATLGLLDALRTRRAQKRLAQSTPPRYQPYGTRHNLLAVLRKVA